MVLIKYWVLRPPKSPRSEVQMVTKMLSLEELEAELKQACDKAIASGYQIYSSDSAAAPSLFLCCPMGALLRWPLSLNNRQEWSLDRNEIYPSYSGVSHFREDIDPHMVASFMRGFDNVEPINYDAAYRLGQKFRQIYK